MSLLRGQRKRLVLVLALAVYGMLSLAVRWRRREKSGSDNVLNNTILDMINLAELHLDHLPALSDRLAAQNLSRDSVELQSRIDQLLSHTQTRQVGTAHAYSNSHPKAPRALHSDALLSEIVCFSLSQRTMLLVGGRRAYSVHAKLLRTLSAFPYLPGRNSLCPGLHFCTWHQICNVEPTPSEIERKLKPPRNATLLRYSYSSSLFASPDRFNIRYHEPYISSATGILERESCWLDDVKKADMVVLHKGPIPAPAWSYEGKGFDLHMDEQDDKNQNLLPVHSQQTSLSDASGEAITATFMYWLPAVINAIAAARSHARGKPKPVIWLGERLPTLPLVQSRTLLEDQRTAFYASQVIMQDQILRRILPQYNIPYIACPMLASGTANTTTAIACDDDSIIRALATTLDWLGR